MFPEISVYRNLVGLLMHVHILFKNMKVTNNNNSWMKTVRCIFGQEPCYVGKLNRDLLGVWGQSLLHLNSKLPSHS